VQQQYPLIVQVRVQQENSPNKFFRRTKSCCHAFCKRRKSHASFTFTLAATLAGNMSTLSELFSKYESALTDVAEELQLCIEKYRHDMAVWSFSCTHPKGGKIRLDLGINYHGEVFLHRWWLYGNGLHKSDRYARELNSDVAAVVDAIRLAIMEISDWPIGDWNNQRKKDDVDLTAEIEFCLDENAQLGVPAWYSGIRPQHRIPGRPYSFFGQIDLLDVQSISPGQCCRAKATCIIKEQDRPYFIPGFCWHICSRDKIIGYARYVSAYHS
jgi:hypothetical protein